MTYLASPSPFSSNFTVLLAISVNREDERPSNIIERRNSFNDERVIRAFVRGEWDSPRWTDKMANETFHPIDISSLSSLSLCLGWLFKLAVFLGFIRLIIEVSFIRLVRYRSVI